MKYPKIDTIFKRDPSTNYKTLLEGQFSRPEFEYLSKNDWIGTEKIDGTNIRIYWNDLASCVTYCGKTDNAEIPQFLLLKLQKMFPVSLFHYVFYPETNMTLYGEGYGAKIQKGGGNYIPTGVSFILFDVRCAGLWLERTSVEDIGKVLGIDVVPIIHYGNLWDAVELTRQGFPSRIGNCRAEGLVLRPMIELSDRRGNRIITKIKTKDFT